MLGISKQGLDGSHNVSLGAIVIVMGSTELYTFSQK